ncbi:hypothetical protein [Vibrio hepatarius]|uniref:hypothetical protein n=1 Tax=Vibrio hepatarius TaxID=171383 RepID=UPI001C08BC27|nr:hypothetical protein [Vibrio hepatarius]MBU2897482.1 hypothetical protein [Vibrio hepatarius]
MQITSISAMSIPLDPAPSLNLPIKQSIKTILNTRIPYQESWSWVPKLNQDKSIITQQNVEQLSDKIWKDKAAPRIIKAYVWRFFRQLNPEECEVWVKHYIFNQILTEWHHRLDKNSYSSMQKILAKQQWLACLFEIPPSFNEEHFNYKIQIQLSNSHKLNQKMIYCLRDFDTTPALISALYLRTTQHLPVEIKLITDQFLLRKSYYLSDRTSLSKQRCNEIIESLIADKA